LTGTAAFLTLRLEVKFARGEIRMPAIVSMCAFLLLSLALVPLLISTSSSADLVVGVQVRDPGVCADTRVLDRIVKRFRHQVTHVPNLPQVGIHEFQAIRENRHLPALPDRPVDRRYCHANVVLTDGYRRDLWYLIEERMGFAGIGANVEFCLAEFDRWNVYGGGCRVLR
jgi:capsid protein